MTSSFPDHEENFQPVKQYIQQAVDQGTATGVAVAVVHRGQIIWEEGFGYADREKQIPSTSQTPYSTASITKAFTTTLVAALSESHSFSLDNSPTPYLRQSPLQGQNGDPDAVTIRMLGAHCSGLPGTFAAHILNGPAPPQSTTAFLNDYGRLAYPPGQIYEYGNIGFAALGALVENITGKSFGAAMHERILQPLGLHDSFFSATHDRIGEAVIGYDETAKRIPLYTTSTPPSGELYASAHDLAQFLLCNLNPDSMRPVLSLKGISELQSPVFTGPRGISSTFGWYTGKLTGGERYYFKGGGQPGVTAKIFFIPSLEVGCAVITNRTDNMTLVEKCCEMILRKYVPDFVVPEEDAGPEAAPFVPTSDVIGVWQGSLTNSGIMEPVCLSIFEDGTAEFALSGELAKPVEDIKAYSPGFEGTTSGIIKCKDGDAFGTRTLVIRLVPWHGRLVGRVTARGIRDGLILANIPYVLTMERVSGLGKGDERQRSDSWRNITMD